MADNQYFIRKQVKSDRTFTSIEKLNEAGRIEELARLLGGVEVTDTTKHHAEEMLSLAEQKKITSIS